MNLDVKNASKILSEATFGKLIKNVKENLYEDMDEGDYYNRTLGVLEGINMSFVDSANKYKIFFDGRKIRPKKGAKGDFNAHADWLYENPGIDNLINWLESGHKVSGVKRDGAFFMRDTKEWLEGVINNINSDSYTGKTLSSVVKNRTITI